MRFSPLELEKVRRIIQRKAEALLGRFYALEPIVESMCLRPFELHLELTNLCNANCVFCPYQFQERSVQAMPDEIFFKAVTDYVSIGGGSVGLTPVVGEALIDPKFIERLRYLREQPQIDRIWLTTNAILLDRVGIDRVLDSGVTAINISTAGFDQRMYERVYRNQSYKRMLRNVEELVRLNSLRPRPISITICLRPDKPIPEVMADADFQGILRYKPSLDFTWAYTSANGRIKRDHLPAQMKLRKVPVNKREPCVQLLNGPIVLSSGDVLACSCVASIDATADLGIGNILEEDLLEIWTGHRMRQIRRGFEDGSLNRTCSGCDMYRDLELYRTSEGRERARINQLRHQGHRVHRQELVNGPFAGG